MTTGKTVALTSWNFVGEVISLLFNMLSRLVIAFLPRSKHLLISWLQSPSAVILKPKKIVCHCFHCFPIYLPWRDQMPWSSFFVCWVLSQPFHSPLSPSSKRLFSSSSLSAIRVMSSAYLRLLIFLPAVLIPACASSSPAFHMMCSAYKLNEQGDKIQYTALTYTPSLILNQSVVPCLIPTAASWPAYRFLRRQIRKSGIPISWRIFHSLLWSTQSKALDKQWSRSRCFSGTLLLFQWSSRYWQFDLWFLCLF